MDDELFDPPPHLSDRSQSIWRDLVPMHARSIGKLTMLRTALEALDLADKATAELGDAKLTVKTLGSGTIHANPLLKVVKECRAQFSQLWQALGFNHHGADHMHLSQWQREREARGE